MATKDQDNLHDRDSLGAPEEAGLPTDKIREKTPHQQAEVASEDFPADAAGHPPALTNPAGDETDRRQSEARNPGKRMSTIQKALVGGIVGIVAMILYVLFRPPESVTGRTQTYVNQTQSADRQTPYRESGIGGVEQPVPETLDEKGLEFSSRRPLSLKLAEEFYLQQDYNKAYAVYSRLSRNLPADADSEEDFSPAQDGHVRTECR